MKSEKWTLVYLELAHGHRQANSNFSWVLLHHDSLRSANLSPNHLLPPTTHIDMADEVYDGAIGIDLGTTYSCVANYEGAGVEIMYVWALKFGEKSGQKMRTCFLTVAIQRQRAGKLHYPFVRLLHRRGASHRRGREEPGRHEPREHRLRCQVSAHPMREGASSWSRAQH